MSNTQHAVTMAYQGNPPYYSGIKEVKIILVNPNGKEDAVKKMSFSRENDFNCTEVDQTSDLQTN